MQVHRGEADTRRSFIKRTAGLLGTSVIAGSTVSCDDDVTVPRSPDVSEGIDRAVEAFLRTTDAPGLALAIVQPTQPGSDDPMIDIRTFGTAVRGGPDPITPTTIFEIGSVDKTIHAFAMTWMWRRLGRIELDGVVQEQLPRDIVTLPIWEAAPQGGTPELLFRDLADFTAGLPDISPSTPQDLFDVINRERADLLQFEPGACYLYSDLAFELLAYTLAFIHSDGNNFEYDPVFVSLFSAANLPMPDTRIELTPDQQQRLACGYRDHNRNCLPVQHGDLLTKSTIEDMSVWLTFHMGFMPDSLLADLVPVVHEVRYDGGRFENGTCKADPPIRTSLGWFINDVPGAGTMYCKNGGTEGFNSFIGFFQEKRTGVVVLTNHVPSNALVLGRELLCMITPGCHTDPPPP